MVLVEALRNDGARVEHIADHFQRGSSDETWFLRVGEWGWYVVTRDKAQRRRTGEIQAIVAAKVGQFVLRGSELRDADIVSAFRVALPAMLRIVSRVEPPVIYNVNAAGRCVPKISGKKIPAKRRKWID